MKINLQDINLTLIEPKNRAGSISVMFLFCKVNFHVVQALQISLFLLGIFLLIRSSMDPAFCGIFVCGPLQFMFIYSCILF